MGADLIRECLFQIENIKTEMKMAVETGNGRVMKGLFKEKNKQNLEIG